MDYVTLFATCVKSKTYFASIEFEKILNSPWPVFLFKTILRENEVFPVVCGNGWQGWTWIETWKSGAVQKSPETIFGKCSLMKLVWYLLHTCSSLVLCLVKVKKPLQKPCTNNLAQRRIQKDRDQSKYIKLKTLQSRRLLQGLIKQREIELSCDISTGQYQSSSGLLRYHEFKEIYMK